MLSLFRPLSRRAVLLAAATLLAVSAAAFEAPQSESPLPEATTALADRVSVTAREFMVVSAHPLASRAGYAVLQAGGTAADAAVAVQAMLGLVEPQSSGLGGGGFAVHWDAALGELTTFDARETAPLAAGPDYWLDGEARPLPFRQAVAGGRSVGVPGTPMLLETLHEKYGRLPWGGLLQPAIDTAEQGFEVSQRLSAAIAQAEGLGRFEAARAYFFDADGRPLAEGATLRNPDYARTLRLMADRGAAPFYGGRIARDIVAAVRATDNPGLLTMEDFARYRVIERAPVCFSYRGDEVCGMGPPSSGALTVGQMLGMLERFDLAALGDGVEARHLFAEASRLAFADRALYMADSDFVAMPKGLLDRAYLRARAALIDPKAAMGKASAGEPPWDETLRLAPDTERPRHGTTHFAIVDGDGNAVSMTTTIEAGFGSRVMTNGFLLNNELTDFSFAPAGEDGRAVANQVEGGKRPRSSMAPTIVLRDGRPVLLTGSPGGAAIIDYVALSLVALLDWDMDPQRAVDLPHVVNLNGPTLVEEGEGAQAMRDALAALGHAVETADLNSGLHVIRIEDGRLTGAADKRREGLVVGR
jgi:gamma-glutamyltranspeptidase/glutathione hydrolase